MSIQNRLTSHAARRTTVDGVNKVSDTVFITFVIFDKANPAPVQYMCGGGNEETKETDDAERGCRESFARCGQVDIWKYFPRWYLVL